MYHTLMFAFEMIRTAGWLVGTLLHGLLLVVLIEGRRKRGTALAYSWLIGSVLLWHLGNLVVAFLGELTGNKLPTVLLAATILAVIGFSLLPSALIHTAVVARKDLFKRPRFTIVLGYLPAGAIVPIVYLMVTMGKDGFLNAFRESAVAVSAAGGWFILSLAITARTMSAPIQDPDLEREHLHFRKGFGVGLFVLAVALTAAVAVEVYTGGSQGAITQTFRVFVMLLSLLPGGLFFYHIYRYRYLDLTLRRGMSFATLVLAVFLAHSLVINRITTTLEATYGVDFALLEGGLVVGVVLLFEPLRRRVQFAIDAALAPDRARRRARLAVVQGEVAAMPPADLRPVVARAREGLEAAFGTFAIVALRIPWSVAEDDEEQGANIACAPPKPKSELAALINWASGDAAPPGKPIARESLPPGAGLAAEKLGLSEVLAVRGEAAGGGGAGSEIPVGFVGLAARTKKQKLGEEDVMALAGLSHTLAASARDADVVRRMVSLEHKLAEAEKLSSLGRLSATIAHEVKNPLSSIKTIVGVLRESGDLSRTADDDMQVISREVNRLTTVVTNLLNVARPAKKPGEGTAVVPSPEGFDTREMLEGLLAVLGPDARRRGVKVQTRFKPGTPRVWARESAIRQAVFQLILNAIEITPTGGTVTVASAIADGSVLPSSRTGLKSQVEIVVEDTGPGIPPDKLDRIFEPFVSMKAGGTGLGLSIARDEVVRAEGRIEAGARKDGLNGARFRVVLPAAARVAPT